MDRSGLRCPRATEDHCTPCTVRRQARCRSVATVTWLSGEMRHVFVRSRRRSSGLHALEQPAGVACSPRVKGVHRKSRGSKALDPEGQELFRACSINVNIRALAPILLRADSAEALSKAIHLAEHRRQRAVLAALFLRRKSSDVSVSQKRVSQQRKQCRQFLALLVVDSFFSYPEVSFYSETRSNGKVSQKPPITLKSLSCIRRLSDARIQNGCGICMTTVFPIFLTS